MGLHSICDKSRAIAKVERTKYVELANRNCEHGVWILSEQDLRVRRELIVFWPRRFKATLTQGRRNLIKWVSFFIILVTGLVVSFISEARQSRLNCELPPTRYNLQVKPSPPKLGPNDKLLTIQVPGVGKGFPVQVVNFASTVRPPVGTVLYLCGGPDVCMKSRPSNVPTNLDVVTYDYLGIGQNTLPTNSPEMRSLESQAGVANEIVKKLQLKNSS